MTPDMQAIVRRLEEVEKQVAHLQALVTEQSDPDRAVVARSFVVKDADGKERAALQLHEGFSGLWLFDANGNPRAGLVVTTEGEPNLALRDTEGRASVDICVDENGPTINLFDANGKPCRIILRDADDKQLLTLEVGERGPKLILFGTDGIARAALAVSSEGPWLDLRDTYGFRAEIGSANLLNETGVTHKTSTASITLSGKDGKVLWSAP